MHKRGGTLTSIEVARVYLSSGVAIAPLSRQSHLEHLLQRWLLQFSCRSDKRSIIVTTCTSIPDVKKNMRTGAC